MKTVPLAILEPRNGAVSTGTPSADRTVQIRMRGQVTGDAPATLFYKWYSSLQGELPTPTPLDFSAPLKVGTHAISFTAKDVVGEDEASLKRVGHIGFAGGRPADSNPAPCVIDVLLAAVSAPVGNQVLSKGTSSLKAVAPSDWGKRKGTTVPALYEPDTAAILQSPIRYEWVLTPAGVAQNAVRLEVNTALATTFEFSGDTPLIACTLPQTLPPGIYTVTLQVKDTREPQVQSTSPAISVTITA